MSGPGFDPEATLALPAASLAVMDAIVGPTDLRNEGITRLVRARRRDLWPLKRRAVTLV